MKSSTAAYPASFFLCSYLSGFILTSSLASLVIAYSSFVVVYSSCILPPSKNGGGNLEKVFVTALYTIG